MKRRQKTLPNASAQLPGKGLPHRAKMDALPCSSNRTILLNEQEHQSKPLIMPRLKQNQAKIKVLPHPGHRNTSIPSSCSKHQMPINQLSHVENQPMAVPLPHLDHLGSAKPTATQLSRTKHWARSTIPSLPFPDFRARTPSAIALPCSENSITPPLSPDLWNKTSLDPEHFPRIPQGFDHWAENVQHLNYWPTISPSPNYQNEVTSHIDSKTKVKSIPSLSFDHWTKVTTTPLLSYNPQSKVPQTLRHYERGIISPIPLQIFSHKYRAKGKPVPCSDSCSKACGEPGTHQRASPLPEVDERKEEKSVKGGLNFNQLVKASDPKHWATYPLGPKDPETEKKLVPNHQVSLPPGPERWTKVLPDSDLRWTKIPPDQEYQAKFPPDSNIYTEFSLGPNYPSNDDLVPDQRPKSLLSPIRKVKSSLDTEWQQREAKMGPKSQVHFASGLNHKVKFIQGTDHSIKYEQRSKQQDGISSCSNCQTRATPDPDKRAKIPLKLRNYPTFALDPTHWDTPSQNTNNQASTYSHPDHQSTLPLGNTQQVTSPTPKQWIKASEAPKHCTTHFPLLKDPDTFSLALDLQQISPLSSKHRQMNPPISDDQLDTPRDPIPSHHDHDATALPQPDKQMKVLSVPKHQTQTTENKESSWYFNYIKPYIVEGGTVHKKTMNNIISSIPQEEIKNDIRKQILLKRMKECTHFQDRTRLCSNYIVCILCASWIPHGCPHLDKMNGEAIAQLLAIPTPVPGSDIRMGIKFILRLPPQKTSLDIYLPFTNFGMPHHKYYSPAFPSSSCSEPMPSESLLVSWLDCSHDQHHQSPQRKTTKSPELLPGKMSKRKEESVESGGIFKAFLERYQMKRREN
uniref:Uncharacterized LOC103099479 n=1 Tax=Monodelphis domestica TaxID=13616 RepID=A0A5F8G4A8_MONDO